MEILTCAGRYFVREDFDMAFINRKYKDSVFTDLFGSDKYGKQNFLALYNALAGTDLKIDEVKLERKVIEQSLYKTFNNDVSWEINGKLIVLVEHQSTVNENMPFRCLEYVMLVQGDFDHSVTGEKSQKVTRGNDQKSHLTPLIIRFPEDCQKQFLPFL